MAKFIHEIRDPIHNFIHFDDDEKKIIDSHPFQRLRYIHQLGLTYLLYPGASHRRFEHCLGVMELSSRVYDKVTDPNNIYHDSIRNLIPKGTYEIEYWRRVLRMAALCHDLGHLPFSHGAESLLANNYDHEDLSRDIILGDGMKQYWDKLKISSEDVAKIALGAKKLKGYEFSDWEAILSEIITSDSFGVDRMDYLLRDSHHTGVAYGKFDHYRLIDTLRILPKSQDDSSEPALGIEQGGIYSAEALILARYFMFTQLYFHPVRRIYDIHLKDFLKKYLKNGTYSNSIDKHLKITDNEISSELSKAAEIIKNKGHEDAKRIINRDHFRVIYERNPIDLQTNPDAAELIFENSKATFGDDNIRYDKYIQKGEAITFPVYTRDQRIVASNLISKTLNDVPIVAIEYVFINPEHKEKAKKWLDEKRQSIITAQ